MKLTKEFSIKTSTEEGYACHIKVEVYGNVVYIVKTYISKLKWNDIVVRRFRTFTVYQEKMTLYRKTFDFINDRILHHPNRV